MTRFLLKKYPKGMWKEETVDRKDDQNQLAIDLPMYRAICHTLDAIYS